MTEGNTKSPSSSTSWNVGVDKMRGNLELMVSVSISSSKEGSSSSSSK